MMKRIVAFLLAVLMCVGLFAGCGNNEPVETTPPATDPVAAEGQETTEPAEFSYPMEGGELTFWNWANGNVTANFPSFEATPLAGWLEEATGVKVDWIDDHSNTDEAFQLMSTDDKLPDIIGHGWLSYAGGTAGAEADGLVIRLNDIIDQYMPNFKAYLEANPDIDKMIKDDNGNYYFFPLINAKSGVYTYGAYVRQDWLNELGGQVPETVDEWYSLLTAVKEKYGVVPYTTTWADLLVRSPFAYAFGVGDGDYRIDDNGKVVYNRTSDEYKAFLETMAKWYSEGLLDQDVASIATADVRTKVINGEAFLSSGWLTSAVQPVEQASEDWDIQPIPTPVVNAGDVATDTSVSWLVSGNGAAITPDCENVELAARYIDYWYSEEGILLTNFGKEGETYNMVDGIPTYTDEVLYGYEEGWTQSQSVARYCAVVSAYYGAVKHEAYYPQLLGEQSIKDAVSIWSSVEGGGYKHKMPSVSYTSEESDAIGRYNTNLKTTADEWALNFILGVVSFDQWDTYVAEMQALGYEDAVAITQSAVDRYNAR